GTGGLDHALLLQPLADGRTARPLVDPHLDPTVARSGVVIGVEARQQRAQAAEGEEDAADDERGGQDEGQAGHPAPTDPPPPAAALLGDPVVVEDRILEVRHESRPFRGLRRRGRPTRSPGGPPVARSVSSAVCRMSTAAAWSTTSRCPRPATPLSRRPR